jgi:hypothetical protein
MEGCRGGQAAKLVLVEAARDVEGERQEAAGRAAVGRQRRSRRDQHAQRDGALFVAQERRVVRGVEQRIEPSRQRSRIGWPHGAYASGQVLGIAAFEIGHAASSLVR